MKNKSNKLISLASFMAGLEKGLLPSTNTLSEFVKTNLNSILVKSFTITLDEYQLLYVYFLNEKNKSAFFMFDMKNMLLSAGEKLTPFNMRNSKMYGVFDSNYLDIINYNVFLPKNENDIEFKMLNMPSSTSMMVYFDEMEKTFVYEHTYFGEDFGEHIKFKILRPI